jgi:hypothetical protein
MSLRASLLAALLLVQANGVAAVTFADLDQVVIVTQRFGYLRARENYVLRRVGAKFLRNGEPFDPQPLRQFVSALNHPSLSRPSRNNLGITQQWLDANVEDAALMQNPDFEEWDANLKSVFLDAFRSLPYASRSLPYIFETIRFDDYLRVEVTARFRSGEKLRWTTESWDPYLLPWRSPLGVKNFDAALSRAVAALLPKHAINAHRLNGSDLVKALSSFVNESTESDRLTLEANNRFPTAMQRLAGSVRLNSAEISTSHSFFYGLPFVNGKPQQENLIVQARHPADPARLKLQAILEIEGSLIPSLDKFIHNPPHLLKVLQRIPWMLSWLERNRDASITAISVNGNTFGPRARDQFRSDMLKLDKPWLLDLLPQDPASVLLVEIVKQQFTSHWLVLPTRKAILWRAEGAESISGLLPQQIPKGECAGDAPTTSRCVGWLFDTRGHLDPRSLIPRDQRCLDEWRVFHGPVVPSGQLYPVHDNGRGGFINASGELVLPLCFDGVREFSEGLGIFEREGRYGAIDSNGRILIAPRFDELDAFHEGLAIFKHNNRYGIIDLRGKRTPLPDFFQVHHFQEGLAVFDADSKNGAINRSGRVVFAVRARLNSTFQDGKIWGTLENGRCAILNTSGQIIAWPKLGPDQQYCWPKSSPAAWRREQREGKWLFLDANNNIQLGPLDYEQVSDFEGDLAMVRLHNGTWGYINRQGTLIWPKPQP